ncbi:MAG: hypothetical protein ACFFBD_25690 [Candidatus Hodarchaeota archaeon]
MEDYIINIEVDEKKPVRIPHLIFGCHRMSRAIIETTNFLYSFPLYEAIRRNKLVSFLQGKGYTDPKDISEILRDERYNWYCKADPRKEYEYTYSDGKALWESQREDTLVQERHIAWAIRPTKAHNSFEIIFQYNSFQNQHIRQIFKDFGFKYYMLRWKSKDKFTLSKGVKIIERCLTHFRKIGGSSKTLPNRFISSKVVRAIEQCPYVVKGKGDPHTWNTNMYFNSWIIQPPFLEAKLWLIYQIARIKQRFRQRELSGTLFFSKKKLQTVWMSARGTDLSEFDDCLAYFVQEGWVILSKDPDKFLLSKMGYDMILRHFSNQTTSRWFGGMAILDRSEDSYALRAYLPPKSQKLFSVPVKGKEEIEFPFLYMKGLEPSDISDLVHNYFQKNHTKA